MSSNDNTNIPNNYKELEIRMLELKNKEDKINSIFKTHRVTKKEKETMIKSTRTKLLKIPTIIWQYIFAALIVFLDSNFISGGAITLLFIGIITDFGLIPTLGDKKSGIGLFDILLTKNPPWVGGPSVMGFAIPVPSLTLQGWAKLIFTIWCIMAGITVYTKNSITDEYMLNEINEGLFFIISYCIPEDILTQILNLLSKLNPVTLLGILGDYGSYKFMNLMAVIGWVSEEQLPPKHDIYGMENMTMINNPATQFPPINTTQGFSLGLDERHIDIFKIQLLGAFYFKMTRIWTPFLSKLYNNYIVDHENIKYIIDSIGEILAWIKKFSVLFYNFDADGMGKMVNDDILKPLEDLLGATYEVGAGAIDLFRSWYHQKQHPAIEGGPTKTPEIEEVFEDNDNLLGGGKTSNKGSKKKKKKKKHMKKSKKGKKINYDKLIKLHETMMYNFRQIIKIYLKYEEFKFKLKDKKLLKKLIEMDDKFNTIFDLYNKLNFNSSKKIQDYLPLLQIVPIDKLLDFKSTEKAISTINKYLKEYNKTIQKSHESLKQEYVKVKKNSKKIVKKKGSFNRLSILPRKLSKKNPSSF